jgi:hypothetical protein
LPLLPIKTSAFVQVPWRWPLACDPLNPGTWQQRIIDLGAIQDANRTDFSALRAKGGKIRMAPGIHDGLVPNRDRSSS